MKNINDMILGLKFAFSYFTILPMKFKNEDDLSTKSVLSYMLLFLPISSFVLSLIVLSIYFIFYDLGWLAAIIASISYLLLYGFIHTDGLIDVIDAIYAKHSGKDPYKVIKESTPLSLKASIQVQRSSGLRESILVHGLMGALEELKMTFLCKFPPST